LHMHQYRPASDVACRETDLAGYFRPSLEVSVAVHEVSTCYADTSKPTEMTSKERTEKYCCCEGSAFGGPGGIFAGLRRLREGRL
jgi:hypothetical protein